MKKSERIIEKWLGNSEITKMSIYERIRNIPYGVSLEPSTTYEDCILAMLQENYGSCTPKHFLLGLLYENQLSIPIKYVSYPFHWDSLDIKYPLKIRKLASEMPTMFHLACKACINEKHVTIDATWDTSLEKFGFPVNKKWDGKSDMKIAVSPLDEVIHENIPERLEFINSQIDGKEDIYFNEKTRKFFSLLNSWLNEIRLI